MNMIDISNEIAKCSKDETLTPQQRTVKMSILKTAIQKENREQSYIALTNKYRILGQKLEESTNGQFVLDSDILITEPHLRSYIANSETSMNLRKKGITKYTFNELVSHANMLEITQKYNPSNTKIAVELYKTIEAIVRVERDEIGAIASGLSYVVGLDIMSAYDEKIIINDNGKATISQEERQISVLDQNQTKALDIIKRYENILGSETYDYTVEMINQVFDNYKNGNRKISMQVSREKQI